MSPPIRDGSGSSIGSIRLGDGSEISEVRTGAGDVLFSAIPDSAVDYFEDGSLKSAYSLDTGDYNVNNNSPVYQGDFSLKWNDGSNTRYVIVADSTNSDFNSTIQRGKVITWLQSVSGSNTDDFGSFYFGLESASDPENNAITGYEAEWDMRSGITTLYRFDSDGSRNLIASDDTRASENTEFKIEVDFDSASNGDIVYSATRVSDSTQVFSMTANDANHDDTGFGFVNRSKSGHTYVRDELDAQ